MEFPLLLLTLGIPIIIYVNAQTEKNSSEPLPYPTYERIPRGLTFTCKSRGPGYFADPEAGCQVWHWCLPSGAKYSFLCPNGTLFNQRVRVCDWWFNVDCMDAPNNYNVNDDLYKNADGKPI
ncbi:conserved hypothetical protein [Pediculus humanus corporis]|uniref:Chitin-binding type-2 domain-containing protein n=1 Tax=Pediculus humanus subsp. corporis TaxID=121224 RepID=E0VAB7_PEDHC|nr:uncharacterized protein Phum_PHUM034480 [Pediculus humanus corporis]EEB10323.1 conserved hypothetical protein [Pediculus humanus corporis]